MIDANWDNVAILAHLNGVNGSFKIVDEKGHQAAELTGIDAISTTQSKFGGGAMRFPLGSTSHVLFAASTDCVLGIQDFTFESWVFPEDTANARPAIFMAGGLGLSPNQICVYCDSNLATAGKYSVMLGNFSITVPFLTSTSSAVYGAWAHIAVSRSGTTWRLFVNGTLEATATSALAATSTAATMIYLSNSSSGYGFQGYLNDFRLTVGYCRYPTAFTPPTEPHPHGPATYDAYNGSVVFHSHFNGEKGGVVFVDRKGHTITPEASASYTPPHIFVGAGRFGGSCVWFNTVGARLSVFSSDFIFGTGDFTAEFWYAANSSYPPRGTLFEALNAAGDGSLFRIETSAFNGDIRVLINGVVVITATYSFPASFATWSFISVARSGNTLRLFVNGTMPGAAYNIGAFDLMGSGQIYIGGSPLTTMCAAYVDEVRITKGVARYIIPFAPPTEPFPDYAPQKLTGTVFDADNNPVAKTVRSYRTSDGLLIDQSVSDPTTGAFELRATDTTEHFVVVHDDTKNALVYDHIVPVI